jgi:uncharacterized membrane protein HdeD (DUF308 family)
MSYVRRQPRDRRGPAEKGAKMGDNEFGGQEFPAMLTAGESWPATLFLGAVTLILGIVVALHPSGSLNVIAVLVGVLAFLSGLFHLSRAFGRAEGRRVWSALSGVFFIVVGVVLIRHLDMTVALMGLLVGITWIVQGLAVLIGAISGPREGAGWWGLFDAISLIAGIVVIASPVKSVTVLAVLVGIWFIIMGLFEVVVALLIRHALSPAPPARPRAAGEESASL